MVNGYKQKTLQKVAALNGGLYNKGVPAESRLDAIETRIQPEKENKTTTTPWHA
jgi:hypothetical protein